MKKIPLTQGQVALVDDSDYEKLSKYKWHARKHRSGNFYVVRATYQKTGKRSVISMARQILGLEQGNLRQVDHRNHNTLDNHRENIRVCTRSQNQMNRKSRLKTSSRFKGVSWNKACKKWRAYIQITGKYRSLGYFKKEKEAAVAYNEMAKKYFGEFAYLNVIV